MNSFHAVVRRAAAACGVPCAFLELSNRAHVGEMPAGWFELARAPLLSGDGLLLGSLIAAGPEARELTLVQKAVFRDFAQIAADLVAFAEGAPGVFSRAVEESLDLVLVTDVTPPSRGGPLIEYANTPLLRATGYTSDELSGKPYNELLSRNNDPLTLRTLNENIESGRDTEKEVLLCRKDGSSFWFEFTSRPMADQTGERQHWIVVGRDITTRRRAHEQMSVLLNAIDAVEHHIEIYQLEDGQYTLAFQNAAANSDTSELLDTLLNESYLPGVTPLREQIRAGKTVTVTPDGLEIRPFGKNAQTLICIRQKAS